MNLNQIFKEFVEVVQENKKYTIGLLDTSGRVIACSQERFVGKKLTVNAGTKEHFFHEILVKNRHFGYLWVASQEDSLKMMGNLLIESLSTRILYELNEDAMRLKVTKDDELVKALLSGEPFDMNKIIQLIHDLKIDQYQTRAAIYIYKVKGFDVNEILHLKVNTRNKKIIYSLLDNNSLLIFKDIPAKISVLEAKTYLSDYIQDLQKWGLTECFYLVGSLQDKLTRQVASYRHCLWLKENVSLILDVPVFFTDYALKSLLAQLQTQELAEVFDYYLENGRQVDQDELVAIADKLYANDFNITQTADELFLHKNTLIYKIKKYEEVFNIDIRGSFQGKGLFYLISQYFREEKKRQQVGVQI